ncbi:uncharacterized protein HMPREF1541_04024 [Cyphellophora europaea CBS 101466]|uniref:Major facilitator superfamily (MFS) profile domain-containing protein n=1 Tax=Cyphellophora europaea (strain CBS 101466) TaxID=1220924 RepID=W2S0G2_CYPE1|nr:uncharacterized protein HMPREF1541_04024 [Cyphellophora europaea CBS 101466]ETN42085.1 hypothetical protein HMPREF1541_04024 [Cyphellophora europaea CBS 101466]
MDEKKDLEKVASVNEEPLKGDIEDIGPREDLDEAGIFLREHNFTQSYLAELLEDKALNKRIVRKVDLTLMPLLCLTYFLQFIDKQGLSYAAVFDLFEDTGITSYQYSWLASIFYFAYLFAEWPSSYLAQHFPTAKVISAFVLTWGSIMLLTAACSNFTGMAICRFLLGCFESVITPAFMLIVSQWYVRRQQPARAGLFYCFNGFGNMIGGILFYAVGYEKNFPVWKVIYLLCGGMTVVWGVVLWFHLPDNIMSARKFTPEEKALLIARSQTNRTGVYNRKIKWGQIFEALTDVQVWILFLFTLLNETINGGIANFGKLIVKGVAGGDPLLATAYGIPQGAFQVFWVFTGPFIASRFKNIRTVIMAVYILPTIAGAIIMWKLPRSNTVGCLLAYYIVGAYVASLVLALQLPATNVGGYTKRVTATAFVFLAYCIGNIIGPHAFLAHEAPIYQTGCKVILSCAAGQIALALCLRMLLIWRNKKRNQAAAAAGIDPGAVETEEEALEDLTDKQNPKFRYSY